MAIKILSGDDEEKPLLIPFTVGNLTRHSYRIFLGGIPEEKIFSYGDKAQREKDERDGKGERIWIECRGSESPRVDPTNRLIDSPLLTRPINHNPYIAADRFEKVLLGLLHDRGLPISVNRIHKEDAKSKKMVATNIVEIYVPPGKNLKQELKNIPQHVWELLGYDKSHSI